MRPEVLIVDDSLTVRMDLAEALETAGFGIRLSSDLRGARAAMTRPGLVLVILDVLLPDGNGLDFLRELKADPVRAEIPVMLLSTEAEVASRISGMQAGADEYVGKPYDLRQVVARARALVQRSAGPSTAPPRRRVLVIDDSPTFRGELADSLEAAGYEVHQAGTGEEGLALAATIAPHAVVVDGVLPGIDGVTVVRRLKTDAALRGVPCLLMTAAEETADELRSLDAGADAYARKSEHLELVLVRIAALLRSDAGVTGDARPSLLGPKRLLAVDDSPTYLDALGEQLRREGYDVVMATSGEEALALLDSQTVDCILLDLMMPGMSGEETCRRIKDAPRWRDIPLVMLTAREDREAMIGGINAGADDYIAKSADFDVLTARLRAQLRRKHFEDENRRIREQLVRRETEARFQQLLHSNLIGVIVIGPDGALRDANDAFLAMTGARREDLAAGALSWDALSTAAPGAAPFATDLRRLDGGDIPVLVGMVPLEGSDTSVGFVVDRTEQRHAEERLEQYARALESSNRELAGAKERAETESRFKSRFLASMSHELRTPLNSIIGFSELLEEELFGPLNPRQKEYAHNVLASGRHLLSLVNDILDLSKIAAGRMQLAREWIAPATLLESVKGMVQSLVTRRGVRFSITAPPDLPDLHVDVVRLRQILFNLLSNAIKFTAPGGEVELIVTPGEEHIEIACRDTGIGMRAEDLPRLFREFEQLDQQGAEPTQGTGLGLALTRRLVELHGGEIRVTSAPGAGSTFTFTLPAPPPGGATEAVVLVVEDDPHAAELIGGHLRAAGMSIVVARHAEEALRLAVQLRPAAITLDLLMPGSDEDGLLGRLEEDPATRDIPVIRLARADAMTPERLVQEVRDAVMRREANQ